MPFSVIPSGTKIDFIGQRKLCAMLSALVIGISLLAIPIRGINLGIDFAGGNEVQVLFEEGVVVDEGMIRQILAETPFVDDASVVRFGTSSDSEFLIRFRLIDEEEGEGLEGAGDASPATGEDSFDPGGGEEIFAGGGDRTEKLQAALREGVGPLIMQRVEFVGPRVGSELQSKGLWSLFWASIAILAYVAIRFSSRFAPGAVVAVIHDLMVTAGIFVILGFEFDLRILAAMLAILGYSLNDTIIIYDRIRENMELRTKVDLPEVLNLSVNQTLSRTILTSGTTLVVLLTLYFLGGDVIRPFAFAMIVGVLVGTYSSVYIASPLLLLLEGLGGEKPVKS